MINENLLKAFEETLSEWPPQFAASTSFIQELLSAYRLKCEQVEELERVNKSMLNLINEAAKLALIKIPLEREGE